MGLARKRFRKGAATMGKVKVLLSVAGVKNRVVNIKNDLKEFENIIGEFIIRTPITPYIYILHDSEAYRMEKAPNMLICTPEGRIKTILAGNAIFAKVNENREIIDLTEEDLNFLEKSIQYFTDDKEGRNKTIYKRIYLNEGAK